MGETKFVFFIPLSNFHSIGGKKRPANLCPSYIADLEKDLCAAFENKKIYVPERREENTLIGLKVLTKDLCRFYANFKNLGATCYMNALLQALFCDNAFRKAVFNWKGTSEEVCILILHMHSEMLTLPG